MERRSFGEYSRAAWGRLIQSRPDLGFLADERGTRPLTPELEGSEGILPEVTLPVQTRDFTIGTIRARKPAEAGDWTLEEKELLRSLSEQLNVALESARLYQETQRRAAQEQLLREISDRMQRAPDMETLMQVSAEELGRVLGSSNAYVVLGREDSNLEPAESEAPTTGDNGDGL